MQLLIPNPNGVGQPLISKSNLWPINLVTISDFAKCKLIFISNKHGNASPIKKTKVSVYMYDMKVI